jgi:GNAT superfamily N-acetyltransferase
MIGPEDIASCQRIIDASLGDLHRRYGLPDDEVAEPDWIHPILSHFLETDPSGTLGAAVNGELDAFASSFRRDDYWFLSFLFVHPSVQGHGLGRALLDTVSPKGRTSFGRPSSSRSSRCRPGCMRASGSCRGRSSIG